MIRYLRASIGIALASAVVAIILLQTGTFAGIDEAVSGFLRLSAAATIAPTWLQYGLVICIALWVAWVVVDVPKFEGKLGIAALIILQAPFLAYITSLFGVFVSPVAGVVAGLLALGLGSLYARTDAGRRKQFLQIVFGQRISEESFDELLKSEEPLDFNGVRMPATVLVFRIGNEDALEESLATDAYRELVNAALEVASDFLVSRGAFIESCDGCSVRAVFGVPLADEKHAEKAILAALDLSGKMVEFNEAADQKWHGIVEYQIGLQSGDVTAGAFGSSRFASYCTSGEVVDIAIRLAAANHIYGTHVLVGPDAFLGAEHTVAMRPIDLFSSTDLAARVEIYEPLGAAESLDPVRKEVQDTFWKALILFREEQYREAEEGFRHITGLTVIDGPSEYYLRRIQEIWSGGSAEQASHLTPLGTL